MAASTASVPSTEAQRLTFFAQPRFHQSLTIPATSTHGELTVTFAVAGVAGDESAPMILFCGGMFCGSWIVAAFDYLAVKSGVRICCIDRPGFGGSTPVPIAQRISVWLETVPLLLKAINATRISLISHSAGTLYLLNTIYHLPHVLDPAGPYAVLLTPYVHHHQSQVKLMYLAASLPASLIVKYWASSFLSVLQLVFLSSPTLGVSSGVLGGMADLLQTKANKEKSEEEKVALEKQCQEATGMGVKGKEDFDRLMIRKGLESGIEGGNDDALLCLKKCEVGLWGVADNYQTYATELGKVWDTFVGQNQGEGVPARKLRLESYFAAEDMMIGKTGQEYFESCFGGGNCGESIDYESFTIEGTDHESILHPFYGPLRKVFEEVRKRSHA